MEARYYHDYLYRAYVADALRAAAWNTSGTAERIRIDRRYVDIVKPKPVETRTAEDVVASLRAKLGGASQ